MILRLLLVLFLGACSSPAYYMQAVSGQKKLMQSRQDIQSLLRDPATSTELVRQLETAEEIKAFALSKLDLPINDSYTSYVKVEGEALVWNVVATEEFSLQAKKWCFPVAGCVPYRGFFEQHKAKKSADRLRDKGMDVIVSPAAAYSSLGWFSDPLLSTMLSGSDTRLAAYLFHELAHQRVYLKGDGLFNEGYANFVEETGVRAWLDFNQQDNELHTWVQLQQVSEDFSKLVGNTRSALAELYSGQETETAMRLKKAEIIRMLESDYERLSTNEWQGKRYYASWFKEPINNARLALYNTYEGSFCAFQGLWEKSGADWQKFHRLVEQKTHLKTDQRQVWLMQTCSGIASKADL